LPATTPKIFFRLIFVVSLLVLWAKPSFSNPSPAEMQEFLLETSVNHSKQPGVALFLMDSEQHLWADKDEILKWRLKLPEGVSPVQYQGKEYYALDWYEGSKYELDYGAMHVFITLPPRHFPETVLSDLPEKVFAKLPEDVGGFLNYDFTGTRTGTQAKTRGTGVTELGVFLPYGVVTNDILYKNIGGNFKPIRLESTWTVDNPETPSRWQFGDATARPSPWGGSVLFGGVKWGTEYDIRPDIVKFPVPSYRGKAALPSNVEVFINESTRLRKEVESGPFLIEDLPVISGEGDIKIVTTDLLGRRQEVIMPYYTSQELLKPGLEDMSVSVGVIRSDFGIASNQYTEPMASGDYRLGITDDFTYGLHTDILKKSQSGGLTLEYLLLNYAILSSSYAVSRDTRGPGRLLSFEFLRQGKFTYGGRGTFTSRDFSSASTLLTSVAPSFTGQVSTGYTFEDFGSLNLSYTLQNRRLEDSTKFLTLSYTKNITNGLNFRTSTLMNLVDKKQNQITFSLVWTLDSDHVLASSYIHRKNQEDQKVTRFRKRLPTGTGFGYNILARKDDNNFYEAGLDYQNNYGKYRFIGSRFKANDSYQLEASGGIIHYGGTTIMARHVDQGFALVEVPDMKDVRVYSNNQLVGTTNSDGKLLIPNLRAHQKNKVYLETKDLPLDAQLLDEPELIFVPYFRSGVRARFDVKRSKSATAQIMMDSGEPVPTGASVKLEDHAQSYPVAYDGEVFLTDLKVGTWKGEAQWKGNRCSFTIQLDKTDDPMPYLGAIGCKHRLTKEQKAIPVLKKDDEAEAEKASKDDSVDGSKGAQSQSGESKLPAVQEQKLTDETGPQDE
jgi:outer membrane usher protein